MHGKELNSTMHDHEWIPITSTTISISWCKKCGTLRTEYLDELDAFEYYSVDRKIEVDHFGYHIGSKDIPACKG